MPKATSLGFGSGFSFVLWVTFNIQAIVLETRYLRRCSKTSFEKNCFSAWASTLNMGLINKVDMVCLSPVGYGV